MAKAGRYRAFQSETLSECMDFVSDMAIYDIQHAQAFGFPPLRDWLAEWNITVRRMAVLRAPIIWC